MRHLVVPVIMVAFLGFFIAAAVMESKRERTEGAVIEIATAYYHHNDLGKCNPPTVSVVDAQQALEGEGVFLPQLPSEDWWEETSQDWHFTYQPDATKTLIIVATRISDEKIVDAEIEQSQQLGLVANCG